MGEAKVISSLVDLSSRVLAFKGAYGGIVIPAKKGPIGEPSLITNESELLAKYTPNSKVEVGYDNAYYSAKAFLSRSNKLWVIRVAGAGYKYGALEVVKSSASGSSAGVSGGVTSPEDHTFGTDGAILIYGANQGVWNNSIKVSIITDSTKVKVSGAFLINVYVGSTLVETWTASRVPGAKDGFNRNIYVEDILLESEYIRAVDNTAVDSSVLPKENSTAATLVGGADGAAVSESEIILGYEKFANKDQYPLTFIMDGGAAIDNVHKAIISVARGRLDCFGILSTPYAAEAAADSYLNDVIAYKNETLNESTPYAAIYTSHLKIYDADNDRSIYVSPDGYVAALYAETADSFAPYYPVSGYDRGNLSALQVNGVRRIYTEGERDLLYDAGINPIRFIPGRGIVLWGQKTLYGTPSALDRINVVMLLVVIRPAIEDYLNELLFELNTLSVDTGVRFLVKTRIAAYLDKHVPNGIYDYRVICDDTNNTAQDVDNNRLNVWVFIKPTKDIEEIMFKTIITPTAVSFDMASTLSLSKSII